MSWDVLLIRTKTNRESMDEIKSENIIPFSQAEIAHEIGKLAAELLSLIHISEPTRPY